MTTPPLNKHATIGIINAIRNETTLKFGLRRGHTITSLIPPGLEAQLLDHLYDLCRTDLIIEHNKERNTALRSEMVAKVQQGEAGSTHVCTPRASTQQAEGGSTHPAKLPPPPNEHPVQ